MADRFLRPTSHGPGSDNWPPSRTRARRFIVRRLFLTPGVGPWLRFLHFARFVRTRVAGLAEPHILDAGFGRGEHLAWLADRVPDARLAGYDTSAGDTYAANFEAARRLVGGPRARLRLRDLRSMDDEDEFDVVCCIDVLEHVPENETVLKGFRRALRPGGLLYLAMPYDRNGRWILPRAAVRRFRTWAEVEHVGEMRSLAETTALLERLGFSVLSARYTFGFPARLAWEFEQLFLAFPGGRWLAVASGPALKALAALELLLPAPKDGNVLVIARRDP